MKLLLTVMFIVPEPLAGRVCSVRRIPSQPALLQPLPATPPWPIVLLLNGPVRTAPPVLKAFIVEARAKMFVRLLLVTLKLYGAVEPFGMSIAALHELNVALSILKLTVAAVGFDTLCTEMA